MARSNATGRLCSSDFLHDISCPQPLLLHGGIIGFSALCGASRGQSRSTYGTCLLSSNDTRSVFPCIPSLRLADSASVVRNGDRISRGRFDRLVGSIRAVLRHLCVTERAFPQSVEPQLQVASMGWLNDAIPSAKLRQTS